MVEGIREFTLLLALVVVAPTATSAARGEETTSLSMDKAVEAAAFEHKRGRLNECVQYC